MGQFLSNLPAIFQWIQFGKKVFDAGKPAYDAVIAAAAAHGATADTDQLDLVILDAARRKAIADVEASATK